MCRAGETYQQEQRVGNDIGEIGDAEEGAGIGEGVDDLRPFAAREFVEALLPAAA